MVLHEKDGVVARHDIHGIFQGDIRAGTTGVVIGHCGHDMPTYRIRFTIRLAGPPSWTTAPTTTSPSADHAKVGRTGSAERPMTLQTLPSCPPRTTSTAADTLS